MNRNAQHTTVLALMATVGVWMLTGCATSASPAQTNRGLKLYKKGQGVYVCRDAHTASTRDELITELEQGASPQDPPTGQSVTIAQRDSVQVNGSTVHVARVEPEQGSGAYWIPYKALCSKG